MSNGFGKILAGMLAMSLNNGGGMQLQRPMMMRGQQRSVPSLFGNQSRWLHRDPLAMSEQLMGGLGANPFIPPGESPFFAGEPARLLAYQQQGFIPSYKLAMPQQRSSNNFLQGLILGALFGLMDDNTQKDFSQYTAEVSFADAPATAEQPQATPEAQPTAAITPEEKEDLEALKPVAEAAKSAGNAGVLTAQGQHELALVSTLEDPRFLFSTLQNGIQGFVDKEDGTLHREDLTAVAMNYYPASTLKSVPIADLVDDFIKKHAYNYDSGIFGGFVWVDKGRISYEDLEVALDNAMVTHKMPVAPGGIANPAFIQFIAEGLAKGKQAPDSLKGWEKIFADGKLTHDEMRKAILAWNRELFNDDEKAGQLPSQYAGKYGYIPLSEKQWKPLFDKMSEDGLPSWVPFQAWIKDVSGRDPGAGITLEKLQQLAQQGAKAQALQQPATAPTHDQIHGQGQQAAAQQLTPEQQQALAAQRAQQQAQAQQAAAQQQQQPPGGQAGQ